MKKFLILLIAVCCYACSTTDVRTSTTHDIVPIKIYVSDATKSVYTLEVEGHTYIVFSGTYKGGIIHAEHCPCKTK